MNQELLFIEKIKEVLKEGLSFHIQQEYDGSAQQNGQSVTLMFLSEPVARFYVWAAENAGLSEVQDAKDYWRNNE